METALKKAGPPEGFWKVVKEICGDGDEAGEPKVGTWMLCVEEEWGLYREEKFRDSVSLVSPFPPISNWEEFVSRVEKKATG